MRRIPGAIALMNHDEIADPQLWEKVGATIARFHAAGLNHVDLNCDNILIAGSDVYLIDFDRCTLKEAVSGSETPGWQTRNLDRLKRSLDKRMNKPFEQVMPGCWKALLAGYEKINPGKPAAE